MSSARDVIARCLGKGAEWAADEILTQLAFDGYTILGPDEIHAPSMEPNVAEAIKALNEADVLVRDHGKPYPSPLLDVWRCVRAALRELMKEKGRG